MALSGTVLNGQVLQLTRTGRCATREAKSWLARQVNEKKSSARIDLVAIGRRIRAIRGSRLTQTEFGRILGIGQTQLSRYELGENRPTLEILLKLRAYSHKTLDWILLGDGQL